MNLRVSTRLVFGFGVLVVLMAISSAFAIYNLIKLADLTRNLYEHPMAVSNAILAADGNIVRMHRSMKDVALAASPADIDAGEKAINDYEQLVNADLAIVKERFRGPPELVEAAVSAFNDWKPIRQTIVNLKRENHDEIAGQITMSIGAQGVAEIAKRVAALKTWSSDEGRSFFENAERARNQTITIALALSGVALVLTLLTGYWVTTSITRPLQMAVDVAETVATGDLSKTIKVSGDDEITKVLRALDAMQAKLRQVAGNLHARAASLASAADQLSVNAQHVAHGSEAQSAAATAMSASVEEMTVSIGQMADHAHDAEQATRHTNDLSNEGGEVIRSAVDEMNKIAEAVNTSSQLIQELARQSMAISSIANVIKEIADQTNLLALNAAIEAARAGEQGRGFAVVADEVRKLAERTTLSTQEISAMIGKIQDGTRTAVVGMETGVARVSAGAARANKAGESITQIKEGSNQVVGAVNDISSALKEQRAASDEIARNVERIAQMVEENNAAVKETATAARGLQTLAGALKDEAAWFRT